ncbi:MAG: DNA polymerase III subunit delta [Balneolaceae bacterium]|nr:DNA polymerase III subunit delta [Balneolaceae bacterium]
MAKNQSSLDTFRALYRDIKKGEALKPVIYLYGEESFLIDMIQEQIEKLIPDEMKDFNFDLLYGSETSAEKAVGIARSYPMMADKRILIIREFQKLDSADGGTILNFLDYFKSPNPTTILCLIDEKFPDKRRDPGKYLNSKQAGNHVGIYEFNKIHENNLPDWIIDWTKHSHRMTINPAAAQLLAQLVGADLKLLSTEIEKLCTFVDTSQEIGTDHVKKITESYREFNVVELKEAVISRDLNKSLKIAEQILQQSNNNTAEVIKTVGFFYSVFSNIWQISRLRERGLSKQEVQTQLGIKSAYIFNLQYREASNFKLAEMPQIFEALLDADSAIKGFSTLDTSSIFLLLIKRIIG